MTQRRSFCKSCLDWSERRHHLAGALGSRMLDRIVELGWASRIKDTRIMTFSAAGEKAMRDTFALHVDVDHVAGLAEHERA